MYLIADTVEESIYYISVSRRLAHLRSNPAAQRPQNQEAAIDMANSLELQGADLSRLFSGGKSGGEMVEDEDLWPCLFGRVKKREAVMGQLAAHRQGADTEVGRYLREEAAVSRLQITDG
jgi:E3 ubiquitin-protein ligase SHPRH